MMQIVKGKMVMNSRYWIGQPGGTAHVERLQPRGSVEFVQYGEQPDGFPERRPVRAHERALHHALKRAELSEYILHDLGMLRGVSSAKSALSARIRAIADAGLPDDGGSADAASHTRAL